VLLDFFYRLRAEGLPVSTGEYLSLLDGMSNQLGVYDLNHFYNFSRLCLIKDEALYDQFDQAFQRYWAGKEKLFDDTLKQIPDEWLKLKDPSSLTDEQKAMVEALGGWDKLMETLEQRMKEQTDQPFVMVTTMPTEAPHYQYIVSEFQRLGVSDHLHNLGPCPFEDVASLISVCSSMGLFSVLESFSNNFVESWRMNKPLVATDADWSRASAGEGAVYVNPDDANQAANSMLKLMSDPSYAAKIARLGAENLSSYPTTKEKCLANLACFEKARQLGCLDEPSRRRLVRWKCSQEH